MRNFATQSFIRIMTNEVPAECIQEVANEILGNRRIGE